MTLFTPCYAISFCRLLSLSTKHSLWISKDFGISWTKVSDYVLSASWDPLNADILYYTYDPLKKMLSELISLFHII